MRNLRELYPELFEKLKVEVKNVDRGVAYSLSMDIYDISDFIDFVDLVIYAGDDVLEGDFEVIWDDFSETLDINHISYNIEDSYLYRHYKNKGLVENMGGYLSIDDPFKREAFLDKFIGGIYNSPNNDIDDINDVFDSVIVRD